MNPRQAARDRIVALIREHETLTIPELMEHGISYADAIQAVPGDDPEVEYFSGYYRLSRVSDYADKIAERIMLDLADLLHVNHFDGEERGEIAARIAQAAREGYAIGYGAAKAETWPWSTQ